MDMLDDMDNFVNRELLQSVMYIPRTPSYFPPPEPEYGVRSWKDFKVKKDLPDLLAALYLVLILFPALTFFAREQKNFTSLNSMLLFLMCSMEYVAQYLCDVKNDDLNINCPEQAWRTGIQFAMCVFTSVCLLPVHKLQRFVMGGNAACLVGFLLLKASQGGDLTDNKMLAVAIAAGCSGGLLCVMWDLGLVVANPITGCYGLVAGGAYFLKLLYFTPKCPLYIKAFISTDRLHCTGGDTCFGLLLELGWLLLAGFGLSFQLLAAPPPGLSYHVDGMEERALSKRVQERTERLKLLSTSAGFSEEDDQQHASKFSRITSEIKSRVRAFTTDSSPSSPQLQRLLSNSDSSTPRYTQNGDEAREDWVFTKERLEMAKDMAPYYILHGDEEFWPISVQDYFRCSTLFEPHSDAVVSDDASMYTHATRQTFMHLQSEDVVVENRNYLCYHLHMKPHRLSERTRMVFMRPDLAYGNVKNEDIDWEAGEQPFVPLRDRLNFRGMESLEQVEKYAWTPVQQFCFLRPTGVFGELDFVYTTYFARSRLVDVGGIAREELLPGEYNFHANCIVVRSNERNPLGFKKKICLMNPYTSKGVWYSPEDLEWEDTHPMVFLAKGGHEPYPGPGIWPRLWEDPSLLGTNVHMSPGDTAYGPIWRPQTDCRSNGSSAGNSEYEQMLMKQSVRTDWEGIQGAKKPDWMGVYILDVAMDDIDSCLYFSGRIIQRSTVIDEMNRILPEISVVSAVFRPEFNQFQYPKHPSLAFTLWEVTNSPENLPESEVDSEPEQSNLSSPPSNRGNRSRRKTIMHKMGSRIGRTESLMKQMQRASEGGQSRRRSSITSERRGSILGIMEDMEQAGRQFEDKTTHLVKTTIKKLQSFGTRSRTNTPLKSQRSFFGRNRGYTADDAEHYPDLIEESSNSSLRGDLPRSISGQLRRLRSNVLFEGDVEDRESTPSLSRTRSLASQIFKWDSRKDFREFRAEQTDGSIQLANIRINSLTKRSNSVEANNLSGGLTDSSELYSPRSSTGRSGSIPSPRSPPPPISLRSKSFSEKSLGGLRKLASRRSRASPEERTSEEPKKPRLRKLTGFTSDSSFSDIDMDDFGPKKERRMRIVMALVELHANLPDSGHVGNKTSIFTAEGGRSGADALSREQKQFFSNLAVFKEKSPILSKLASKLGGSFSKKKEKELTRTSSRGSRGSTSPREPREGSPDSGSASPTKTSTKTSTDEPRQNPFHWANRNPSRESAKSFRSLAVDSMDSGQMDSGQMDVLSMAGSSVYNAAAPRPIRTLSTSAFLVPSTSSDSDSGSKSTLGSRFIGTPSTSEEEGQYAQSVGISSRVSAVMSSRFGDHLGSEVRSIPAPPSTQDFGEVEASASLRSAGHLRIEGAAGQEGVAAAAARDDDGEMSIIEIDVEGDSDVPELLLENSEDDSSGRAGSGSGASEDD